MEKQKDIRQIYSVPAGYFENLETRLSKIAVPESIGMEEPVSEVAPVSLWTTLKPYVSLAAVFASAIVGGTILLNRTGGITEVGVGSYEQLFYADLIPITYDLYQMEEFFTYDDEDDYYMSDEEFYEYMIQTGTTLDQIEEINE